MTENNLMKENIIAKFIIEKNSKIKYDWENL